VRASSPAMSAVGEFAFASGCPNVLNETPLSLFKCGYTLLRSVQLLDCFLVTTCGLAETTSDLCEFPRTLASKVLPRVPPVSAPTSSSRQPWMVCRPNRGDWADRTESRWVPKAAAHMPTLSAFEPVFAGLGKVRDTLKRSSTARRGERCRLAA